MDTINRYPGIARACFAVTMGAGGLHRGRTSAMVYVEMDAWIMGVEENENWKLEPIDAWFLTLTDDEIMTAAEGEETEMAELLAKGPPNTADLLNGYYEKVA